MKMLLCLVLCGLLFSAWGVAPAQQPQPSPAPSPASSPSAASASPTSQSEAQGTPAVAPNGQTAAPPTAANTIRANARLVILDAVVVDTKGVPIKDLTREQFRIQEDGADQTVINFVPPGRFTPAPDVTIDSTADLDRVAPRAPVNIILLDEFNTLFEDMAFARYSLGKWLKGQPDKLDTPTMLLSVSLNKFEVLHDYTQNKDEILQALDHHFSAYPWQAHNYSWVGERYATAFFTLRRVAEATNGHPGHKNMIWIGRGFPSVSWVRFSPVDRDNVHTAMQGTINELRDARVTLYTIDPAGVMVDPSRYGSEAGLFDPFGGEPNFQKIASETGGRNLYGRNDVDAEIGTSIRDGASFYTLTYRPTNAVRDVNHFRKITITVDGRPDLKVVTRQGYFDSRAPARLTPDGGANRRLASELAGAETSAMVYDAVPLTLTAADTPTKFLLHLDAKSMPWSVSSAGEPRQAKLIVTVTTFDKKGKVLKSDARALTLDAKRTEPPSGPINGPLTVPFEVPPDPKAVRARFVVRVNASGRMGTADVDLLHPPQAASAGSAGSATP